MRTLIGFAIVLIVSASALVAQQTRSDTVFRRVAATATPRIATLVTEVTVGRADGPAEYLLADVEVIALRKDGSIFIGEGGRTITNVREYDSTGKYVRTFGRRGEGPGEFSNISGISFHPDGRVLILDGRRIQVFAANGTFLTTWPMDRFIGTSGFPGGFFTRSDGMTYLGVRTVPYSPPVIPAPVLFARFNSNGVFVDTLPPPVAPFAPANALIQNPSGTTRPMAIPFARSFTIRMSQIGYYITGRSDQRGFTLHLPSTSGGREVMWTAASPVTSIQHAGPAVPFTAEQRQSLIDRVTRGPTLGGRSAGSANWNGHEAPRNRPAFLDIVTNAEGRVFLVGFDPDRDYSVDEINDWDDGVPMAMEVYEPDGRYVGRIRTEPQSMLLPAYGDKALLFKSVNDILQISRVRIVWP